MIRNEKERYKSPGFAYGFYENDLEPAVIRMKEIQVKGMEAYCAENYSSIY
jgi:hypothetical protein